MWTKETIIDLLAKSDKAVNRAVLAIYEGQTSDEQASETTQHSNGIGFNAYDARRGSYYAEYIGRRGSLSGRHLEIARKMMRKYAGQLASIANAKRPEGPAAVEVAIQDASLESLREIEQQIEADAMGYQQAKQKRADVRGSW
jgi:hypothetical protein